MIKKRDFRVQNDILRLKIFKFLKKSYLDIVYCQNVVGYTLQHFLTHFALFHYHFDPFWGDLLKKLRLDATLEARFRGSERGSTGLKKFFSEEIVFGHCLLPKCDWLHLATFLDSFRAVSSSFRLVLGRFA